MRMCRIEGRNPLCLIARRRCIVRPPYLIKLRVGMAVVIAGMALIAWVARSSRAEDPAPKEPAPATPTVDLPQAGSGPAALELPSPARDKAAPPTPAAKPEFPPDRHRYSPEPRRSGER